MLLCREAPTHSAPGIFIGGVNRVIDRFSSKLQGDPTGTYESEPYSFEG